MDLGNWFRFLSNALGVRKHLLPDVDNQYDLGASDAAWKNAYLDGAISGDAVTSDSYNASVAKVVKTDADGGLRLDHLEVGNVTGAAEGEVKVAASGSFGGGLNVGTATGAAAGDIKASLDIYGRAIFPGLQTTCYLHYAFNHIYWYNGSTYVQLD